MKNNQFAQINVPFSSMIDELKQIHFIDGNNSTTTNPSFLFYSFLKKAFPEITSEDEIDVKLNKLLATPTMTLTAYLKAEKPTTPEVFYLVALQLLHFQADVDFKIDQPLAAMKQLNLAVINGHEHWTTDDLTKAWYTLLTTHTKLGQTYLDDLANRGFFKSFYGRNAPLFFNGKAQPVFDTDKLIREVVYVESDVDADHDGKLDLLKVEITRPSVASGNVKVPVIYTASPYDQGTNDFAGKQQTHDVNVPLTEKATNHLTKADISFQQEKISIPAKRKISSRTTQASETHRPKPGYTLNDYLLVRGFAVVYASGIGTKDSDGIQTCGSVEQTKATTAVIEWLTGKRIAFTNRTDQIAIDAWWSTGKIAMTGRSYLGTLATAAATTGIDGLKTIISEAAISSWYDYYRENGLVAAPEGFPGEDADVLAAETFSRSLDLGDNLNIDPIFKKSLSKMTENMDRLGGSYNNFWDERNYRNQAKNIKADVILVHGLNDYNVKPKNAEKLWQCIKDLPIAKKIILHQGHHIYINDFRSLDFTDMMNLWLSHELYNIQNGAKKQLPNVIVQSNAEPEMWSSANDWDNGTKNDFKLNQATSLVMFKDVLPEEQFKAYAEQPQKWERNLLNGAPALSNNQITIKSAPLTQNRMINGCPIVHLNLASSSQVGMISVQLVDYGEAKRLTDYPTVLSPKGIQLGYKWYNDDLREFTLQHQKTPYKMISKGHLNLQNRTNPWKNESITPNQFYSVDLELQPNVYTILKSHRIGVVIYATDFETTVRGNQQIKYTVNLDKSRISIPFEE